MSSVLISACGGALASASACFSVAALGRFASLSRSTSSLFGGRLEEVDDRLAASRNAAFVSGVLASGFMLPISTVDAFGRVGLAAFESASVAASLHPTAPALILAGLLTGAGAQMARGGLVAHTFTALPAGINASKSALATAVIGATAIGTANVVQTIPALQELVFMDPAVAKQSLDAIIVADGPSMVAFLSGSVAFLTWRERLRLLPSVSRLERLKPLVASWATGAGIGAGVTLIGLANPDRVLQLLAPLVHSSFDPSLLVGASFLVGLNAVGLPRAMAREKPLVSKEFHIPGRLNGDNGEDVSPSKASLLVGSTLFGLGFGLTGMTPLATAAAMSSGSASFLVWSTSMLTGVGIVNWTQTKHLQ